MTDLHNLSLFAHLLFRVLGMTGLAPGILLVLAIEALCPICRKPTLCEHDLACLESAVKLRANHERWREETRREQAEQMEIERRKKTARAA